MIHKKEVQTQHLGSHEHTKEESMRIRMRKQEKRTTENSKMGITTYLSIITLNVFNALIKRHGELNG